MVEVAYEKEAVCVPNPGGQERFANDWKHFLVALEGGWYCGKTYIGSRKLLTLHNFNAFDEEGDATYVASLCVAPTYNNALDFCVPHLQQACIEAGLNYEWKGSGSIAKGKYAAPAILLSDLGTRINPSVILIRSAEVPKRITGFTVGAAWGDEPTRWKIDRFDPLNDPFIQLTGRVRDPKAGLLQIILTYTNEGDVTRAYEEMHSGGSDRKLYRAPTSENPTAKDFAKQQKRILTAELAEQYLGGKALRLRGGRVYSSFDFDLNVKKLTLRKDIPLQATFDFNIVPGMHVEIGQHHGDADLVTTLYEIYGPRMSVIQAMDEFVALTKKLKWQWKSPLEVFGDATGGSEWSGTGESNYQIICKKLKEQRIPYRIRVPKSNPLVDDRINAVNCALMDITGEIHYLIDPQCKRLISDYRTVQRDKYGEIDKRDRKLSHPSDADGYRIEYIRPVRVETSLVGGRINVL